VDFTATGYFEVHQTAFGWTRRNDTQVRFYWDERWRTGTLCFPTEEPQVFKIKLPDVSHLSMPIYSHGNNKEYLAHIVAVLWVIEQKGLPKKCRVLVKAVARWSKALENIQEAAESRDTVSTWRL
jgi:hypothetical protein